MEREYLEKLLVNKDVIYEESFWASLQDVSLLEFRKTINMVQDIRPSLYLEDKVDKYYDDLLAEYDEETGLFRVYYKLLDWLRAERYDLLDDYQKFDYFINEEMILKLRDFRHYKEGLELAYEYLLQNTSLKISEIVVDGLFKDTIYNVWLNIKEMLRYHEGLTEVETLLGEEKKKFYQKIVEIDKLNNGEKLKLYSENKKKKIALMFYEDWLLVRRDSYRRIKDSLFRIEEKSEFLNKELSQQNGIPVYELQGEDFYILVCCLKSYSPTTKVRRNCYSLISADNMKVFSKRNFIYGYTDFNSEDIFHVFEKDICSANSFSSNSFTTYYVNRIMTPKQISNSNGYSEIQIVNKVGGNNDFLGIRPSYLVVFDRIEERHIKEADRLGIGIVRINSAKYWKRINNSKHDSETLGFKKFESIVDVYTNGGNLEKEKRMRR